MIPYINYQDIVAKKINGLQIDPEGNVTLTASITNKRTIQGDYLLCTKKN